MTATAASDRPDPGLFGPGSVTWRVHSDPSMAVAGLRALLLQATHPQAMAGVAQFSDYRENPWRRLSTTAAFVVRTTFGTVEQAERLGARVQQVHERLTGVDDTGAPYRVADPALLRWVHVCEAESFLSTYARSGGRLAAGDADRYYDEMQRAAALVGCDDVPRSAAEVQDYLRAMRPDLRVTREARAGAFFIVNPPMPRWVTWATPAKPAWWTLGSLGFALLPRWARRLYALPGLPTTDLVASLGARAVRTALLAVPARLRDGPAVKDARARLALDG